MSYPHFPTDCDDYHPEAFAALAERDARPRVVCICGSMRFMFNMLEVSVDESLAGHIVVLPLVNMKQPDARWDTDQQREQLKAGLDRLHFAKIDLADEILVVNVGGYIGDSTRREIAYATERGKPVRYVVPVDTAEKIARAFTAANEIRALAGGEDPK